MADKEQNDLLSEFMDDLDANQSSFVEAELDATAGVVDEGKPEVLEIEAKPEDIEPNSVDKEEVQPAAEEKPTEDDPMALMREELAKAYALVNQLKAGQQAYPQETKPEAAKPEEKPEPKQQIATSPQANFSDLVSKIKNNQIFTQEELDSVIDKPEILNVAISRKLEEVMASMLGVIPQITEQYVSAHVTVNKVVTEFFDQNRDLVPYGDFVQTIVAQKEREGYSSKTYKEIFSEAATEARKRLRLEEPGVVTQTPGKQTPNTGAFAGGRKGGQRPAAGEKTKLFDENAADLLDFIP